MSGDEGRESAFSRFPPRMQEAIVANLGWTSLRPVQELAGQALLDGNNAVVLAPTAGGKTEAAMFPALAELVARPPESVGVIYIAPIKALLNNQEVRLGTYAEMVGLSRFVWHGDVTAQAKATFIKEPAQILMTTPESLEVMLVSPRTPAPKLFADLRMIVIDEVHAIAGTDRGAHLMAVIERLRLLSRNDIQRVGLSATVGNPTEILRWLQGTSARRGVVVDPPKVKAQRELAVRLFPSLLALAQAATGAAAGRKSLFFCQSRALTETVADHMRGGAIDVYVHHSSVSLEERKAAEDRFAHGSNTCIVCTSTLELGIDVGDLDSVLQANAPSTVSAFLQRMGRTGRRAGTTANTTFFCDEPEAALQAIALVELAKSGWVESVPQLTRCWPVLVHQLLVLTLQFGAISEERCWAQLSVVPDFAGVSRAEFAELVAHLVAADYLMNASGLLTMGLAAERAFGRKNFSELYAVFSSPVLYRVVTLAGRELGSLEQNFVDRLVENMSSFLLAGRAWIVNRVNHEDRLVLVDAAPAGSKPSWGGFVPQLLSYELCERIRQLLIDSSPVPYADASVNKWLAGQRGDMAVLLNGAAPMQAESNVVRWWTFAGGRINHTLRYALELNRSWRVIVDNFVVRVEGPGVTLAEVRQALAEIRAPAFWRDDRNRLAMMAALPEYRMSKFQRCLPDKWAVEVVGAYLLDFDGAAQWLAWRMRG